MNENGQCVPCQGFEHPSSDGRTCVAEACNEKNYEYLGYNSGTGTFECTKCTQKYHYPNLARRGCENRACDEAAYQFLNSNGGCEPCGDNQHPDPVLGTSCITRTCGARAALQPDGSCKACAAFAVADATGKACTPLPCGAFQILNAEGTCTDCAKVAPDQSNQHPNAQGTACVKLECESHQQVVFDEDSGTYKCKDCGAYTFPNASGRQCQAVSCPTAYDILNSSGACVPCPATVGGQACANNYCFPDETGRACKVLACPAFAFMNTKGECVDCAKHQAH